MRTAGAPHLSALRLGGPLLQREGRGRRLRRRPQPRQLLGSGRCRRLCAVLSQLQVGAAHLQPVTCNAVQCSSSKEKGYWVLLLTVALLL